MKRTSDSLGSSQTRRTSSLELTSRTPMSEPAERDPAGPDSVMPEGAGPAENATPRSAAHSSAQAVLTKRS